MEEDQTPTSQRWPRERRWSTDERLAHLESAVFDESGNNRLKTIEELIRSAKWIFTIASWVVTVGSGVAVIIAFLKGKA